MNLLLAAVLLDIAAVVLAASGVALVIAGLAVMRIRRLERRLANLDKPLPRRSIEHGRERWADLVNPVSRPLTDEDAAWLARLQRDLREL